jgi:hypothetical protein
MTKTPRLATALVTLLAFAFLACGEDPVVASLEMKPTSLVVRRGECAVEELTWTILAPLEKHEGNPAVFLHLLDGPHSLVRTFDHRLPFEWTPGTKHTYPVYICQSALAPPLKEGMYGVKVGLYDDIIGYRWPLRTSGEMVGRRGYRLGRAIVPANADRGPRFSFTGDWGVPEDAADKQYYTRRLIPASASVRVSGMSGPGAVLVGIRAKGSSGEPLTITTSCGPEVVRVNTTAEVEIPVTANGECDVRFSAPEPAYHLETLGYVRMPAQSSVIPSDSEGSVE